MIKLKKLLKEGYAWERKANKPLPTLKDVQKEYQKKKMQEVLKDKDGNVRTDLKYTDNNNYQPSIELVNSKSDGNGYPTITVKIDGGPPFDIQFDEVGDEIDNHGYEREVILLGGDEGGNEWVMQGSVAYHGDVTDYDIDTLEMEE
jgi:hypothetical protein